MRLLALLFVAIFDLAIGKPAPAARMAPPCQPWADRFDLDGDGRKDRVEVGFTSGAHCCYELAVELSSGRRYSFPWHLDGGYVCGLDLSNPYRFAVRDIDGDGLPDLFMVIETYGMDLLPIPRRWTKKYGIRGHVIAASFRKGRLHVWDVAPRRRR